MHLRDEHRLRDLFLCDVQAFGYLEVSRLASQLLEKRASALADAVQRARTVEGHSHYPRLLGKSLQYALANPPHRVRKNLMPFVSSNLWAARINRGCLVDEI